MLQFFDKLLNNEIWNGLMAILDQQRILSDTGTLEII